MLVLAPWELHAIEGEPLLIPLTFVNRAGMAFEYRFEPLARVFVTVEELDNAGRRLSYLVRRKPSRFCGWGFEEEAPLLTVLPGGSANVVVDVRQWIARLGAGRYRVTLFVVLPNGPVRVCRTHLVIRAAPEELQAQLRRLGAEIAGAAAFDHAPLHLLDQYSPEASVDLCLRLLAQPAGGEPVLSQLGRVLSSGRVRDPGRVAQRLAEFAENHPEALFGGNTVREFVAELVVPQDRTDVAEAIEQHLGVSPVVRQVTPEVPDVVVLPADDEDSGVVPRAPWPAQAQARRWQSVALVQSGVLLGLVAGALAFRRRRSAAARPRETETTRGSGAGRRGDDNA